MAIHGLSYIRGFSIESFRCRFEALSLGPLAELLRQECHFLCTAMRPPWQPMTPCKTQYRLLLDEMPLRKSKCDVQRIGQQTPVNIARRKPMLKEDVDLHYRRQALYAVSLCSVYRVLRKDAIVCKFKTSITRRT